MKQLSFFMLLFGSSLLLLMNCSKKNKEPDNTIHENKFSFQYNGQTYSGTRNGGIINNRMEQIFIRNTAVFGGYIYFYSDRPGCAFLLPDTSSGYGLSSLCELHLGSPIDSVLVYFYRSGSINYSYSNCQHKKTPDFVFGGYIEYDECTVTVTFSLTLGNKNNETITITNGSFVFHGIRK